MGENWAVDMAQKSIANTVKNPNRLFDWTVGSYIRSKSLQEAIPIAAKQGTQIGAVIGAVLAPLIWDCSISVYKSYKRVLRPLWEETIPKKEIATIWDKIVFGGVTSISFVAVLYGIRQDFTR